MSIPMAMLVYRVVGERDACISSQKGGDEADFVS